jgi:hypothetical protein
MVQKVLFANRQRAAKEGTHARDSKPHAKIKENPGKI